jgi:trans-aconitate 2-methyltransferase
MTQDSDRAAGYVEAAFSGRPGSISAFLDAVLTRVGKGKRLRVLDLGCGTGDLALQLFQHRPDIDVVGLDISEPNIAEANRRAAKIASDGKPTFHVGDYSDWSEGVFDVIVSDSVLHLIPMTSGALSQKLASDLVPGGKLIVAMPGACAHNTILIWQRRLWRATPRAFDNLGLACARLVHSKEPLHVLEDRISYMRMLPERQFDPDFENQMRNAGLIVEENIPWPGASFFKLRHRFIVLGRSRPR